MTKEQKENLTSILLLVMMFAALGFVVGENTYSLYKYHKAEKHKKEIKAKQTNLSLEKTIYFNQRQK